MSDKALTKIDRYEIRSELGRGGMASVYLAWDPRFEREVAIKVLPKAFMHDPQFRGRFEQESRIIASLEHAAIVPVYDTGEDNGQPYLVMRYMTGRSLASRLKEASLSVTEAGRLLARVAPALDHAHEKGVIHRDLKPANILFDRYGDPYIADFGIAKLSEASLAFTGSGIIGTPMYMSPEQARGEKDIDGRSDVYALGAILFEMLTGKLPYEAETPMGVAMRHITDPVPRILDVNPDLPPGCEAIIARAMAKDRNHRFGTAREMADMLTAVAQGVPYEPSTLRAAPPVQTAAAPASRPTRLDGDSEPKTPVLGTLMGIRTGPLTERIHQITEAIPFDDPEGAIRLTRTIAGVLLLGLVGFGIVLGIVGIAPLKILWPAFIFGLGFVGYLTMTHTGRHAAWLAIPSTIIAGLGVLLFYQNLFQHWQSWTYAWAFLPVFTGLGMMISGRWGHNEQMLGAGRKVARITLIIAGLLALLVEVLFNLGGSILSRLVLVAMLVALGIWLVKSGHKPKTSLPPADDENVS